MVRDEKEAALMTAIILQGTGYPDVRSLDWGVASEFKASPLAVRSARHILARAMAEPLPLRQAIDEVFEASPEMREPVRRIREKADPPHTARGFLQVRACFLYGPALTRDLDLETACDVPIVFPRYGYREPHPILPAWWCS
jgi:hypothetical protein